MSPKSRRVAVLSLAASIAVLFSMGIDASAQEKKPATKAVSACKGLDEKACKGRTAECLWIAPKKGKQKPYCRVKTATKKKT